MLRLDHIAVCAETLEAGTAWVEAQLGVSLDPGGQHARYGTHNRLLGLGDVYLEVIALDPAAPRTGPSWFALDHFHGPPRLGNWICETDQIGAAPAICGAPVALTRGDLHWQITVPEDGSLPQDGAYPTLISWAPGTHHPARRLPDRGIRLTGWEVTHPQADAIADALDLPDARVRFRNGPAGFRATFETAHGPRSLT